MNYQMKSNPYRRNQRVRPKRPYYTEPDITWARCKDFALTWSPFLVLFVIVALTLYTR